MNSSPAAPCAEPRAIGPARWSWRLGPRLGPAVLAGGLIAAMGGAINPAAAQQAGYGQTLGSSQQEREVNFGTGPKRSSSILDSTNPLDLIFIGFRAPRKLPKPIDAKYIDANPIDAVPREALRHQACASF